MNTLPIISAHNHLVIATPEGFPNRFLKKMSDTKIGFGILKAFLHCANPFSKQDSLDKLLTFIQANKDMSMVSMFNKLRSEGGYSPRTKFVILTVNMAFMGCGIVKKTFGEVCMELERLRQDNPDIVIPFLHTDCRSGNMVHLFLEYVENGYWGGVKMYNSMGTMPTDNRYNYIYSTLQRINKPIIAHCTYGNPIYYRGGKKKLKELLGDLYDSELSEKDNCCKFTDPLNWEKVAKLYPNLRICLAHFGGSQHWKEWSKNPNDKKNLVNVILGVLERNPNIYADISFTLNDKSLYPMFYKLMTRDEYSFIRERVLFGSDWYMNKTECTERQWADDLEFSIGSEMFNKIARENTHRFLGYANNNK